MGLESNLYVEGYTIFNNFELVLILGAGEDEKSEWT